MRVVRSSGFHRCTESMSKLVVQVMKKRSDRIDEQEGFWRLNEVFVWMSDASVVADGVQCIQNRGE